MIEAGERQRRRTLVLVSLASFMTALDAMVVTAAIPTIRDDLHTAVETLQWTVNAYNLCFAVFLMTGAALGERFGRRGVFLIGMFGFVVGSVWCGLSTNVAWLIAGRAVQGLSAALIAPVAMAILSTAFAGPQRARALGVFGSITGLALIAGPVLGGAITQGLSWQWVFWINLPVGTLVMALVRKDVAESKGTPVPVDVTGTGLLTVASFGLAWALIRSHATGWTDAQVALSWMGGLLCLALFVIHSRRAAAPMVPPRLFESGSLTWALLASSMLYAPLYSVLFLLPQLLQTQGGSTLELGLQLLPWTATLFVVAPFAGRFAAKLGDRPVAIFGLLLQALGIAALGLLAGHGHPFWILAPAMIVAGVGISAAMPALQNAAISSVAPPDIGRASGLFNTVRFFAGSCGIALATEAFVRGGGAAGVQQVQAGFEASLMLLAGLSVLGTAFASKLPRSGHPVP